VGPRAGLDSVTKRKISSPDRPARSLVRLFNCRIYVKEIGWEDVEWIYLAQNRD